MQTVHFGNSIITGLILGLKALYAGYIGLYWDILGYIGDILGIYWGYIGIMEKNMETTISGSRA